MRPCHLSRLFLLRIEHIIWERTFSTKWTIQSNLIPCLCLSVLVGWELLCPRPPSCSHNNTLVCENFVSSHRCSSMSAPISQHWWAVVGWFYSVLFFLTVFINHFVPSGNEHSAEELVSSPICGRVNMPKEVPLFCAVVYKAQGKKMHLRFMKRSILFIFSAKKALKH